jgi:protein-disulfide isomerase
MSRLRRPVSPDDHYLGAHDAPVLLVEYGDFQCPYCGEAYWEVKRLQQGLGSRLGFVFRHFPLTQAHPLALQAAEAAEAAASQGHFWEMHDLLFENQDALELPVLLSHAEALSLDMDRFRADLDSHRFEERVHRDLLDGARSGVNGTPTFFANGHRHDGAFDAGSLLASLTGGLGTWR